MLSGWLVLLVDLLRIFCLYCILVMKKDMERKVVVMI